eukprot:1012549_1
MLKNPYVQSALPYVSMGYTPNLYGHGMPIYHGTKYNNNPIQKYNNNHMAHQQIENMYETQNSEKKGPLHSQWRVKMRRCRLKNGQRVIFPASQVNMDKFHKICNYDPNAPDASYSIDINTVVPPHQRFNTYGNNRPIMGGLNGMMPLNMPMMMNPMSMNSMSMNPMMMNPMSMNPMMMNPMSMNPILNQPYIGHHNHHIGQPNINIYANHKPNIKSPVQIEPTPKPTPLPTTSTLPPKKQNTINIPHTYGNMGMNMGMGNMGMNMRYGMNMNPYINQYMHPMMMNPYMMGGNYGQYNQYPRYGYG